MLSTLARRLVRPRGGRRKPQPHRTAERRLVYEGLEDRRLMSAVPADTGLTFYYALKDSHRTIQNTYGDVGSIRPSNNDIVKLSLFGDGRYQHEIVFHGKQHDLGDDSGNEERIAALAALPDGDFLISTEGRFEAKPAQSLTAEGKDVLRYDVQTRKWSIAFDGSKAGIYGDTSVDAVDVLSDGRLLMSVDKDATVKGIGHVQDEDLFTYNESNKEFKFYFDGGQVGLGSSSKEDVKAVAVVNQSHRASAVDLLLSTVGNFRTVDNVTGTGRDLLRFDPTRLGTDTRGSFDIELYGRDVGLTYNSFYGLDIVQGDRPGVVRGNTWMLDLDGEDHDPEDTARYGRSSDIQVSGDFNGDGRDTSAVVRRSTSGDLVWKIDLNGDFRADKTVTFGRVGNTPVVGDVDGDGRDDLGYVFTDRNGYLNWRFDTTLGNKAVDVTYSTRFGLSTDTALMGDVDGDGDDDLAVVRNNAVGGLDWFFNTSHHDHQVDVTRRFGLWGDRPVMGDWNGDGTDDVGAVRTEGAYLVWYFDLDGDPWAEAKLLYGLTGDEIVVGQWNRF